MPSISRKTSLPVVFISTNDNAHPREREGKMAKRGEGENNEIRTCDDEEGI